MKNTSTSLFSQVLDLVNQRGFDEIVKKHNADKHLQSFDSWAHFVSMTFCQLAQANSLREICGGLKACGGKLNHLGLSEAPTKSNLSYANGHRNPEFFKDLFFMENSAAYIQGWREKLREKENKKWLIQAAGAAQKAVDHILNRTSNQEEPGHE